MYIHFSLQIDNLVNFLTQSIQFCINIVTVIEKFIVSSKVNHECMTSSQSKFVLPNLLIAVNLSKYEKILYLLCKSKKYFIIAL